jgi:oxaloacetate decarboxylase alpha subunit
MHDVDAVLATSKMIKEEGGSQVVVALTYTLSEVHDDAFYASFASTAAKSPDVDLAYLKDPSGLLTPERARALIPAIQKEMNGKPLELHSHCTIGLAPLTYMVAADLGIDGVHTGAGALGDGTSLPPAERVVANLREAGHSVDVDDEALAEVSDYYCRMAAAEGLPSGAPREYDAAFLRHQIPGGVMTTLKRQLAEIGMEDRLNEVIHESERVRAELGYPIMVTPFPQMVIAQALINVTGKERYERIPDQVIRYALGRFGRPTMPIDPDIEDRIMNQNRTKSVKAEPAAISLKERRKAFPNVRSDEEFLLRAVMPENEVNAMMKADQTPKSYNPDARPIVELLKGLLERPAREEIIVEKPGFRLELRANEHERA